MRYRNWHLINLPRYFLYLSLKVIRHKIRNYQFYSHTGVIPRGSAAVVYNSKNITIGNNFSMGLDCKLYAQDKYSKIIIGENVGLNDNVYINSDHGGLIEIGSNTIIGPGVVMRASNHNFDNTIKPFREQGHKSGSIKLGENVWLGANVIVLPNVVIGKNVVIGAGSIVTKDIPDNSLAFGIPATIHRRIADE